MPTLADLYTPRAWYCPTCARRGVILQHHRDTVFAVERLRLAAHEAQRERCDGEALEWVPLEVEP